MDGGFSRHLSFQQNAGDLIAIGANTVEFQRLNKAPSLYAATGI